MTKSARHRRFSGAIVGTVPRVSNTYFFTRHGDGIDCSHPSLKKSSDMVTLKVTKAAETAVLLLHKSDSIPGTENTTDPTYVEVTFLR